MLAKDIASNFHVNYELSSLLVSFCTLLVVGKRAFLSFLSPQNIVCTRRDGEKKRR